MKREGRKEERKATTTEPSFCKSWQPHMLHVISFPPSPSKAPTTSTHQHQIASGHHPETTPSISFPRKHHAKPWPWPHQILARQPLSSRRPGAHQGEPRASAASLASSSSTSTRSCAWNEAEQRRRRHGREDPKLHGRHPPRRSTPFQQAGLARRRSGELLNLPGKVSYSISRPSVCSVVEHSACRSSAAVSFFSPSIPSRTASSACSKYWASSRCTSLCSFPVQHPHWRAVAITAPSVARRCRRARLQ